jgi:tripartite-type tricarboxylate transporter receptor subunit TctC
MPIRMAALAAALCLTSASFAVAQTYPSRPVTFVVPFAPGGSTDTVARIIAQAIGPALGQPTVVENRTGGAGVIGWGSVARSAADGHTLITVEMSYAIAAGLIPTLPFDPRKSFTHITTAVSVPHVMVINPQGAGQQRARADRARQGEPRQSVLRLRRERHQHPYGR